MKSEPLKFWDAPLGWTLFALFMSYMLYYNNPHFAAIADFLFFGGLRLVQFAVPLLRQAWTLLFETVQYCWAFMLRLYVQHCC